MIFSVDIKLNWVYDSTIKRKGENELDKLQISLAAARVNAEMTQDDVAKEMHISKQTIVNWEKGKSEPTISQAKSLAELYKIKLDYIFLPSKPN